MLTVIKERSLPIEKTISMKNIIGKKVIARSGKKIGSVEDIHIDPRQFTVEGIKINPGITEPYEYIDKNYIESFHGESVTLLINPVKEIMGADVLDSEGKKIGSVKEIYRPGETNNVGSIRVGRFLKKDLMIEKKDIKEMNEKFVVLKTTIKEA